MSEVRVQIGPKSARITLTKGRALKLVQELIKAVRDETAPRVTVLALEPGRPTPSVKAYADHTPLKE